MEFKELKKQREKAQKVTNIINQDFDFMWDGIDYTIKKWDTETYPYYLAEHCAIHMARIYCRENNLKYENKVWEIVDKIMGKEFIDYDKLTLAKAKELAKKRWIALEDKWVDKNKTTLIQELKITH